MKKLLRRIFNPVVLALLGLASAALLIWFIGPLLALGAWRPLEREPVRWALIGAIAAAWVLKQAWRLVRARRRNARLLDGLQPVAPAMPQPATPAQAEIAALDKGFTRALEVLRQARVSALARRPGLAGLLSLSGRSYLYDSPWYVFIGAPGSGKTTALLNSGLSFPLAEKLGTATVKGMGGTRNCDWWFTDDAILLDTAGRYTTQESHQADDAAAWQGFLQLLKRTRPRRPINGVLLTLSVEELLQQSPTQRESHAATLRARLQELHETLQIRFPVYLLVTKADLLAGFNEFFGALSKAERAQVWGTSFAYRPDAQDADTGAGVAPAQFEGEFDALHQRLVDRVLERMQALRDPAQRALVHAFPHQFAQLKPLLAETIARVFAASRLEQAPPLRGVYFTSGTQEGTPIDRLMGALARSLRLSRSLPPSAASSGRSYFITRLLQEVVFPEQGLAGSDLRWERRLSLLRWSTCALAAVALAALAGAWVTSYSRNQAYVAQVQQRLPPLQQQVQVLSRAGARPDAVALLPLLDQVRELASTSEVQGGAGWSMGLGLYQGDKLGAASRQAYERLLHDALLPSLSNRIEEQLRGAGAANLEFAYEALKAYLMLHDTEHFDAGALRGWILFDWQRSLPATLDLAQRRRLESHLAALLEQDGLSSQQPPDAALVANVRTMLARYPLADRVYSRLKRQGIGADVPEFRIDKAAGPAATLAFARASGAPLTQGVAGLYTHDGYHKAFVQAAREVAAQMAKEEPWVLGRSAQAVDAQRLTEDVRRLYLADYARLWEAFVADIRLVRAPDLAQSIQLARLLSAPDTPLAPLLRALSRETTLGPKPGGDKTLTERAGERLQDTQKDLQRLFGTAAGQPPPPPAAALESIVDDRFTELRRLVTPAAPGQPAPVDGVITLINEVYTMLSAAETAVKANVTPPPSDVPAKVKAAAARQTEPVRSMLINLTTTGVVQMANATRSTLSGAVAASFGDFCRQAVAARYPFVRGSARDALPDDFARLFAPGGLIDAFFQKNLADKVDISTRPWSFRQLNDVSFGGPGSLVQFQRAQAIRDVFFRGGGSAPSLRLEFKPLEMDAGVTQFILDVDGQLVKYSHGPQVPQSVQWPGPRGSTQVRLQMQPPGAGGVSGVTREGPWALFRLFDSVQIEPTAAPERFRATFVVDGRQALFEVTASSVVNPFRLRDMEQFQCPAGL